MYFFSYQDLFQKKRDEQCTRDEYGGQWPGATPVVTAVGSSLYSLRTQKHL